MKRLILGLVVVFLIRANQVDGASLAGLGTLGGSGSYACGLSDDGSVVVGMSKNSSGQQEAFRWEDGSMIGLGALGGQRSVATGVSADGSVVVGHFRKVISVNAVYHWEPFRWENNNMAGLGTLGGSYSDAYSVSADGSVVAGQSENGFGDFEGFRWEGGSRAGLGNPGATYVWVRDMSADGSVIVGEYHLTSEPSGEPRAFRWENGVFTDIDTVLGRQSSAYGVSADGSTVVAWLKSEERDHAFIWNADDGMQEIESLLTADLTDWRLTDARDISADGTVIVGRGWHPLSRVEESWIVDLSGSPVPEPSTFVMWSIFAALGLAYQSHQVVTATKFSLSRCERPVVIAGAYEGRRPIGRGLAGRSSTARERRRSGSS